MVTGSADMWNRGIFLALKYALHLIAAVHFWYGIFFDFLYVYPPKDHPAYKPLTSFGGKFRYLTILGAIVQASYFTLCVLNDVIGTNENYPKRPSKLRKLKDYIFATFAFPLAMNVAISFWSIYAIDRELILPKSFESFFPNWLNHVMHTNIVFFILLELLVSFRQYPAGKSGFIGLLVFNIFYVIWIHIIKFKTDRWVYPVLEVLNLPQRIGFILFIGIFGISFYFVGEYVNKRVWANELKSNKSSIHKHK
ncbi:androgen-induced gene 1 protein-like isoform X1 [Contarinia nasturtii]|uniref:androgen-induced gene 1 protein-like isoform X1 n=1 Tax=Contarinia nasturtii TaxID=265458 RepID=UPI0012D3E7A6|nr:androgen-induced gene 1 protein-like isoform X1 [Contarinia nasturtii]